MMPFRFGRQEARLMFRITAGLYHCTLDQYNSVNTSPGCGIFGFLSFQKKNKKSETVETLQTTPFPPSIWRLGKSHRCQLNMPPPSQSVDVLVRFARREKILLEFSVVELSSCAQRYSINRFWIWRIHLQSLL